jgi:hypothetical protein
MAPAVADLMAAELAWSEAHRMREIASFRQLAANYLP